MALGITWLGVRLPDSWHPVFGRKPLRKSYFWAGTGCQCYTISAGKPQGDPTCYGICPTSYS
jgi:hypothetical protein